MIDFTCACGQTLYFENTACLRCGARVGYDPRARRMLPLATGADGIPRGEAGPLCRNGIDFGVCNWIVGAGQNPGGFCLSCRLNQTIPNLRDGSRLHWWKQLELAKRRLIFTLLELNLPVTGKHESAGGLAFRFVEDRRSNPDVAEEHVYTGHSEGVVTINPAEADEVRREIARRDSGELYRTVLGHFRHESGHYYFNVLVGQGPRLARFRELFGDETRDYAAALARYYAGPRIRDPEFISAYAQSHPLEDWAETWAHYLHMTDTLQTAAGHGLPQGSGHADSFDDLQRKWSQLAIVLNSLNRSMGLEDAYPFVLSPATLTKLRFVHELVCPSSPPSAAAASAGTRA